MILIADSGSTKTEWSLLMDDGSRKSFITIGLNPFFIDSKRIQAELGRVALDAFASSVTEVFFYGAGCSSPERNQIIEVGISSVFYNAVIKVNTDMLAACRAMFGSKSGIVAILGTGSNSAYYNGTSIIFTPPSLGYILGDEGSGNHLGRLLLKDYLENKLSRSLHEQFEASFSLSQQTIIHKIYKEPFANRFLAQFSKFLYLHRSEPYCSQLLTRSFSSFIEHSLMAHKELNQSEIRFVGSVAYYFKEELAALAAQYQLNFTRFVKSPSEGLISYHQGLMQR